MRFRPASGQGRLSVHAKIEVPMSPDLERVSRLQELDRRIGELQREVAALPKHIAQIEKTLDSHLRRLEADRAALAANQKERRRLEDEVKVQQQKISKLRDQTLGAKTNEQYRAFQHEIEFCEKEIRKYEDRILDLMGESEPLEANVKKAEAALKEEQHHVDAEKAHATQATSRDEKELDRLRNDRKDVVSDLNPQLYNAYERIRKKWHGAALAEVIDGRCSACQIVLRPQFLQDLKRGDAMMFCESCGRILFYNPPIAVEPDLAAAPHAQ
jgi:predicted  nucleic acid-binding Zn-ribbon protein